MNIPYVMKRCTKCGEWKVASTINFHRQKKGKYGLKGECKECKKKYSKRYRENNKDKIAQYCKANKDKKREYDKQYYEANKEKIAERDKRYNKANKEKIAERRKQYYRANRDKILERNKQWYEDNKDKVVEYHKQYYQDNKEKIAEHSKQYREANKEKIFERSKQYHEDNKEKINERHKQYYQDNKDKIREQHKQYYQDNKEKVRERHKQYDKQYYQTPQGQVVAFNKRQRRRIKEEQQGTGITKDQWLEMMNFFNWKCAYSGEALTKDNRSVDHIVPLNIGGDNIIWNMAPMKLNYNSSKQDKDMLEWYKEQDFYDPKRLAKIYEWQEYAYNKYGKDSEYFNTNDIQIKLL